MRRIVPTSSAARCFAAAVASLAVLGTAVPEASGQEPRGFSLTPPSLITEGSEPEEAALGPHAAALDSRSEALETALLDAYVSLDGVGVVALLRSSITAVYEGYCALSNLIPPEEGFDALGLTLGLGCLVGSATLLVLSGMRLGALSRDEEAGASYRRFRQARRRGEVTETLIEEALLGLEEAAADSETERVVSLVLGGASIAAAVVLTVLTATGDIDPATGTAIAAGSAVVGGLSLIPAWIESPAEQALRRFRAEAAAH